MFKNVTCPACGRVNQISNVRKYLGKKVRLNCLNTACGKEMVLDLTEAEDSDKTVVIRNPKNVSIGGKLIQKKDNHAVAEFILNKNENIAGRNSPNFKADIIVQNDPFISRKQFMIKASSPAEDSGNISFSLCDCNSKNKTFLNGQALEAREEVFLKDGDIIEAGKSAFEFRIF
ncbi:MAG: FHA domain-containing protein [Saprospiraceae bacterium]|jgi:hypothetical protein